MTAVEQTRHLATAIPGPKSSALIGRFRDAEFGKELATDGELAAKRAIGVIDKQVGAENLAAVIIEPIQGEGGFIVPAQEALMKERLGRLQADDDRIGDVRARGAMIAVELVKPGGIEPDADLTKALCAAAHSQGVIGLSCGAYGNVLRFLPPLSISDALLDEGLLTVAG